MQTQYESGSARYRFQSGEYSPSTQGTGPPHGISLRKHNPPADGRGPDRPGPRGSAAVLISGMKNPGLSGNLMYTKGCISFRRFSARVKLSRHQRECLSAFPP